MVGEQSSAIVQENVANKLDGAASPLLINTNQTGRESSASDSYEERKIKLAETGELIPAFKHSAFKAPMARLDRKGNEIGRDRKKFHISYADQIDKRPLAQVHCVESYKKYNAEDPIQGEMPCCTLF